MSNIETIIKSRGTLVVCSHSGGKDSQAMYLFLKNVVPSDRLVVIHAALGVVEWPGTIDHIKKTISHELEIVSNHNKTFLQMVERRGMWPSPKNRQCTSDLKRGPIRARIRQICNKRGFDMVIDCLGLRAEESAARSKKKVFQRIESQCNSKRNWCQWLPIHDWTTKAVFDFIEMNGQNPHWAYSQGMTRLSCSFCIMSSEKDLKTAAKLRPDLLKVYVDLEDKIGHTFIMPTKKNGKRNLAQIINS